MDRIIRFALTREIMGGIELREDELIVERARNALDELAIEFSSLLTERDIDHAFVAGYVSILTGRARSTDDIDVLIEQLPEEEIDSLVDALRENDYWGPAMPLDATYENLSEGTNIWR